MCESCVVTICCGYHCALHHTFAVTALIDIHKASRNDYPFVADIRYKGIWKSGALLAAGTAPEKFHTLLGIPPLPQRTES